MSDVTPHLGLPLIAAAQAQKHVTHNEALGLLDALVQLACLDKDLAVPPASPAEGDRYLVTAASPGGAWAGLTGQVVRFADGVWTGSAPRPGWFAYVMDEADLYIFDGTAWTSFRRAITAIAVTGRLGINTTADATNRLAVKSDAALLSWDDATPGTGDMRVSVNKKAPARDAGLVFQTGYSARALIGTLGGDDFSLKVSPDGATYVTALTAAAGTGAVAFAASPTAPTPAAGDASGRLATTAFVAAAVAAGGGGIPATRRVVGAGLAVGGGDLTADRTLTVPRASAAMAAAGTDDASAVTPLALAAPLAAKVGTGRQVLAAGLAVGGGDLSDDRTITVPKASGAAAAAGADDASAVTPLALATPLAAKVGTARQVTGAGLATGGGDLSADRTITVPKASQADVATGTDDARALTALSVAAAFAGKVGTGRQVLAGSGLTGGGALSADRTLAVAANGVTNALLAQVPAGTLKGNATASAGNVGDYTPAAILDAAFGAAQGSLLYRGSAGWAALAPGASGQVLTCGGSAGNPAWASAGGGTTGNAAALDDLRTLAIQVAKLRGTVAGMFGGVADDFRDQSGIDAAASSGQSYDATGNVYAGGGAGGTETAQSLPAMTGNAVPSGHVASASSVFSAAYPAFQGFDQSGSTSWYSASGSGGFPHWLARQTPAAITLAAYAITCNSAPEAPSAWKLQGSSDGTTWTDLDAQSGIAWASDGQRQVFTVPAGARGAFGRHRLYVTLGTGGRDYCGLREVELLQVLSGTLDLRSVAFAAQAVPTKGSLFVLAKATAGTMTPNTSLIASMSRDGGTTWTDLALAQTGTLGTYAVLEANGQDVSGQPSGTAMKWRLRTVGTALSVAVDAVVAQWG